MEKFAYYLLQFMQLEKATLDSAIDSGIMVRGFLLQTFTFISTCHTQTGRTASHGDH